MNYWSEKEINEMVGALAKCKSSEDVCALLEVILTPREINDAGRRYKIKMLLEEGKTYSEIRMILGASNDIIGRVAAGIGYGFRRTDAKIKIVGTTVPKKKYIDPLKRRKGIYYKGMPSPGTMVRNLKK